MVRMSHEGSVGRSLGGGEHVCRLLPQGPVGVGGGVGCPSLTPEASDLLLPSAPHRTPEQNPNQFYPEKNEGSENQGRVSGIQKTEYAGKQAQERASLGWALPLLQA